MTTKEEPKEATAKTTTPVETTLSTTFQFCDITLKIPESESTSEGEKEVNMKKNRYQATFPYDHNRIILQNRSDFYFNGSILDSKWVATQGPLPNTLVDFYDVIWEKDVRIVVQLTECNYADPDELDIPKQKSHPYWPLVLNVPTRVENLPGCITKPSSMIKHNSEIITITKTKETQVKDLIARKLTLQKDGKEKYVTHLHYKGWPNGGVPRSAQDFLDFANLVKLAADQLSPETDRAMMHCSAGVGRTGCFYIIQQILNQANSIINFNNDNNNSNELDNIIYRLVVDLRKKRMNSVDNQQQYEWLQKIARSLNSAELKVKTISEGAYKDMEDNLCAFFISSSQWWDFYTSLPPR